MLRERGCQIAARTCRDCTGSTRRCRSLAISDATVTNQGRDLAWQLDHQSGRRMTPEGLHRRPTMTVLVRRTTPHASRGSVDRAMRSLGLEGIRRSTGVRATIPATDSKRAGDLLDRDVTADAPNRTRGHERHRRPHLGGVR
ncbi:MAG: hypothetical protein CSA84_06975, partial [Actinomycetales bacterium]